LCPAPLGQTPDVRPNHSLSKLRRAAATAKREDLFLYSAALAFYGLVSVAPLVVVALWLTSLVVGVDEVRLAATRFAEFAPAAVGADRAFQRVADLGTSLGLLALAGALWPATAYGSGLIRVFDRLSIGRPRPAARALKGRGVALALVAVVPVLILASLLAAYAGTRVLGDGPILTVVGFVLAFACGFAVTGAGVTVLYRVFPHAPPPWRANVRGTLVAATGISLLSVGYVAYLRLGTNFEQRYASDALAAVVLLGVWLFFANVALLTGYKAALKASG